MESTMEQIRTRLQKGESPQDLIKKGFKRTTVYSIARKMKGELKKDSDAQSLERALYLACIVREVMAAGLSQDMHFDSKEEPRYWVSTIETASEQFEQVTGRKPPQDFLATLLKLSEYKYE